MPEILNQKRSLSLAILAASNSIHTTRWVSSLARRGHRVHLISAHSSDSLEEHSLKFKAPQGYLLNVWQLKRLLKKLSPDLLHIHYASGYGTLGTLSGFHPRILSVWGSDVFSFSEKNFLFRKLVRHNLETADWISSTSQVMATKVKALVSRRKSVSVIPFGVDFSLFHPRKRSRPRSVLTIGTTKGLDRRYGTDLLIRGFAQLKRERGHELRLEIIGDGPDRRGIETLIKEEQISDSVTLIGTVPHAKLPDYLKDWDIYVAVSREESFGVAVIEASAMGLAVVASRIGGLPEAVEDGKTGWLISSEDREALVHALKTLVCNAELRQQLGQAGAAWVREKYDWEENLSMMEDLYYRCSSRK